MLFSVPSVPPWRKNNIMKQLPIGISTFEEIRTKDCYYVDKTPYVKHLVDQGKYYFLSRPRRFGKSLFVDTLKEAFTGNKSLFKELYLEENWNWDEIHPVILISFGGGVVQSRGELDESITDRLMETYNHYGLKMNKKRTSAQFRDLIIQLHKTFNQKVVVLVDEYDKPILDNISDSDKAAEIREGLKNIYSVIKDSDAYLEFAFLTGVSKFAKVSLFSGLNNLEDLSLDSFFSAICGYTQIELETVFFDKLGGVDLSELKKWYNGYNFLGELVYNPYDILLFLKNKLYKNYWFETATPSFLLKLIRKKKFFIPTLHKLMATDSLLGNFDIDKIEIETLLFQTGYLTIKETKYLGHLVQYQLGYPNYEVKSSLNDSLLSYLTDEFSEKENKKALLYEHLYSNDMNSLQALFHSFYASIPNDWYRKNTLSGYEGYYASIFYCYFAALGLDVTPEDTTNKGRIDLTLKFEGRVYIFEFKVIELISSQGKAIDQIKTKKYHEKYINDSDEIYLIGVEFSRETRNIVNFEWERFHHGGTENTEKKQ